MGAGQDSIDRQIGRLEGGQEAIEKSIAGMQEQNSREHAEVVRQLEGIRADLGAKADTTRVDNHAKRIREIEDNDLHGTGEAAGTERTLKLLQGLIVLAIGVGGYLFGVGHP